MQQAGFADVLLARIQGAAALEELFAADGLQRGGLVDDWCLVQDVMGGDGGLDAVVLVLVVLHERDDDVVHVVVDGLLYLFALVDDLMVDRCLFHLVTVAVAMGNRGQQLSVLVRRCMLLADMGDRVGLCVHLFGRMLFVLDRLVVHLDMMLMTFELTLPFDLLDVVRVLCLARHAGQVLNGLRHLALAQIGIGKVVAVRMTVSAIDSGHGLAAACAGLCISARGCLVCRTGAGSSAGHGGCATLLVRPVFMLIDRGTVGRGQVGGV